MFNPSRVLCLAAAAMLFCFSATAYGQKTNPILYPDDPFLLKKQFIPKTYHPEHITKKPGHYTITDWDEAIDETWGRGLPKAEKLQIFDTFWETIDDEFAAFVGLPGYYPQLWDDLRNLYRTEIETGDPTYGVSRGRFAAIMNYLAAGLMESHTNAEDELVCWYTYLDPGIPLLVVGAWGWESHFGAGLTPLEDNTLLVYKTLPHHPLGLEPGDIVLGYDGFLWNDLYQELLTAQLPIVSWWWGSSEYTFNYSFLISAGLNWHLFDIIDIAKYNTGETVHLSTAPLEDLEPVIQITEQMDIPGVPMPDLNAGERVTFGIIDGTQIGYIYVMSWSGNVESEFYNALSSLMNDYETAGLIIDYRTNYGGSLVIPLAGLSLLYNTREPTTDFGMRCSPYNHLSMCPSNNPGSNMIPGNPSNYYDRPIAVLVGPGAMSAGDQIPLWMKSHPMVRHFGRPTAGAFTACTNLNVGDDDWYSRYAIFNSYLVDDPGNYLTHTDLQVDEDVWLTPDDVALGYDTVVEAAETWINSFSGLQPDIAYDPQSIEITVEYGQTATRELTLENIGNRHLFYSLTPQTENRLWLESDRDNTLSNPMPPREPDLSTVEDLSKPGAYKEARFPPVITGHGGPDAYGHIWTDSDQPHGPAYQWIDISDFGTQVNLGDNSYAGPFDIGFDFPFYENIYSELYICSNGMLTLSYGSSTYNNVGIPSSNFPNDFIAPWWDDLNLSAYGEVYYYHDEGNEQFIISYIAVPIGYWGGGGFLTFQAILYPDGQIDLNYATMERPNPSSYAMACATIGIENSDGTDGLEVVYNAQYMHDNLTIRIKADWMGISPYSGHIAVGENTVATVTFNAGNFLPGWYSGNIYLDSNDPDEPLITIPVSLEVSGCVYTPGDCNHNGTALELNDVIAMIGMYRGTVDPYYTCDCPPHGSDFAPEADPNGNCIALELGDVVTEIGAYRGTTEASSCEDCAGLLRLIPGGEDQPITPALKTRAKNKKNSISR